MYPGWLVLATSCLGILAARRLASWGAISRTASWVAHSLYGAKMAMLLLPEASLVGPSVAWLTETRRPSAPLLSG
jgi:hypothetical protein